MSTIAIVLALLLVPAAIGRAVERRGRGAGAARLGGIIGLSLAFAFFALGRVVMPDALAAMLPGFVPAPHALVLVTGLLELAIALALLIPRSRRMAGWAAVAVLVLFFPANIHAALHAVGPGGHQWGPTYLLVRAPLQLVLLAWAWWFVLLRAGPSRDGEAARGRGRDRPDRLGGGGPAERGP